MRHGGKVFGSTAAALALTFGAAQCAPFAATTVAAEAASQTVTGRLAVVGGTVDPATLDARINGAPASIAADGTIVATVPDADQYQLSITGPGIFDAVFTFGAAEVARPGGAHALPPVELVARAPGRVEMFFGGDTMLGRRFEEPIWGERALIRPESRAADMAALIAPMRPYFAGSDLASLNLETVLAAGELANAPDKSVVFHTHSDAAQALADAGIDYVSLGNNHVYDYVEPGLAATTAALDRAKIAWSGAGPNEAEALKAARIAVGGNLYAMLGFVGWKGTAQPNQVAEAKKGGAAFGSDENIAAAVAREAKAGHAPIVQYHGSSEYSARPTAISERRMKLAIDRGAALVVSHHPHVAHGLELHKGRLIAYSLGNYLFDQYFPETHAAFALKVWMDGDTLFRAEIVPIQILDYRPVPAVGDMRQAALRRIIDLSAERGTAIGIVGGHGVIVPGAPATAPRLCPATAGSRLAIYRYDLHAPSVPCAAAGAGPAGRDLLMRGDFEAMRHGDASDRSWAILGANADLIAPGHGGRQALRLRADGASMVLAPKTFFRATGARRYTLSGWVRTGDKAEIEALVQQQPKGSNRLRALETAPARGFGSTRLSGMGWQPFRFDLELGTDAAALPLRPLLRIRDAKEVMLDDIAFIAWEAEGPEGETPPGRSHAEAGE
ncbi:MAG TPA: CapA family protein [Sphingopyxis sp.]|nr:CapA family protein [Sphingopyxis sp.]